MWSRAQLKDKAKYTFRRNYWKVVLVSVLVILFGGGSSSATSFNYNYSNNDISLNDDYDTDNSYGDVDDYYDDIYDDIYDGIYGESDNNDSGKATFVIGAIVIIIIVVILIIAIVIGVLLQTFILNPLLVGGKRFFFKNLKDAASVKEIAFAFDNNYKNVVKVMFLKGLYTFLWSLLFIIPGIVKSYEYKMIPFLLAENPGMSKEQAFALSKQMMEGQKWKVFILDLSFIGWHLLSAYTLGILDIFYVRPYVNMTEAALYEALCYQRSYAGYGGPQVNIQANPYSQANQYATQQPNMPTATPEPNKAPVQNEVPVQNETQEQ